MFTKIGSLLISEYKSPFGIFTGWFHHHRRMSYANNKLLVSGMKPVAQNFLPKIHIFFVAAVSNFLLPNQTFSGYFYFCCQQVHSMNSKPTDHVNHTVEYGGSLLFAGKTTHSTYNSHLINRIDVTIANTHHITRMTFLDTFLRSGIGLHSI